MAKKKPKKKARTARKKAPAAKKRPKRAAKARARAKSPAKRKAKPKRVAAKRAAPKRTAKKSVKRVAAKAAAAKPAAAKRAAAKPAEPKAPSRAAAERPAAAAAPVAAATGGDDLRETIEATLVHRSYDAGNTTLVDVLTAVARGYRNGPASPPAWLALDVNTPIAEGIVDRYETGDRSPGPDRATHRPQVRATVGFNLDQLGLDGTGDDEREVLTTLCLGAWDPATQTHAELDATASFLVPWYRAGR